MTNLFCPDGFFLFVGVVEDIFDPLEIGRVRVRMFGYHDADKTVLPTGDLPWAMPIMPVTSASISGKGSAPVGVLQGAWVVGFFMDGADMQQPFIFGTISGSLPSITGAQRMGTYTQPPERELVKNKNDGILKDSNGKPVVDAQGNPIAVATPTVEGWVLGQTSEAFETGNRGPGTISVPGGDYGGTSYGSYQAASFLPTIMPDGKSRQNWKKSPLMQYLSYSKYGSLFDGLAPASKEFDDKWKQIAADETASFKKDQHDWIKTKFYDVMVSGLKRNGIDVTGFGPAVQDCVWSTSVQYGPNAYSVFLKPLSNKSNLSDKEFVTLVQEYKLKTVEVYFKSSSANIQDGIKKRCASEKDALLKLVK